MATNPLLLDPTNPAIIRRLPVPDTSGTIPTDAAPPVLPVAAPPTVVQAPNAAQNTTTRLLGDQNELKRLRDTGSGISQIQNPFLRGLARAGEIGETIFSPGAAALTPGTSMHNRYLQNQTQGDINNDLKNQQSEAQTTLLDAQPQLKQQALENTMLKNQNLFQHQNDMLDAQQERNHQTYLSNLRNHGYTVDETDPTGQKTRPLRYEEMSGTQQAVEDLKHSQSELADANAALKKAGNDPSSPAFQLAKQRVDNATRSGNVAANKLGLQRQTVQAALYGTDLDGNALPGAMLGDDGKPIGARFQQNVRPTGTERNKGDMAASAADQINDMKAIIQRNPTLFGPGYGQTAEFKRWIGAQSPDAQRFVAARTIAGDHLAGTFGGRSEAALQALDNAAGQFKDNPQAALAGLDQLAGANQRFLHAGTVRTAGSNASKSTSAQGSSGLAVSLKEAKALPQFKGKSDAEVTAAIKAAGHEVRP